MRKIIETEIGSGFSKQLYSMLVGEWNDMEAFESTRFGLSIPNPMVVEEHNQVIGGAAFTRYQKPDSNDVVIWLNALYIRPESRGQGIATDLIYACIVLQKDCMRLLMLLICTLKQAGI